MEQDKIRSRSRLQNVMDILAAKKVDIYEKIRTAEAEGRRCTTEIQEWLRAVVRLEKDRRRTIEEKNRFFTWNYFLKQRRLIREARALKQQSEILPILVARANPDLVQKIPVPDRFMMHDSLESNLNKVLNFIRGGDDKVRGGKIGIRGMAGVGKTTLLRSINNALLKAADQSYFVIYVHISKEITVKKLQIKISERLNLDLPRNASTAFQASIIFNFLRKKEFVLLLDDLWESIDLQEVGIPCLESSSDGLKQKVVFTTRNEAICSNMNVDINIIVEPLNSETAWQLFERTIGKNSLGSDERVHCLAREIVSICKGLPLALIASGQIMATKHTVEDWDDTVKAMQRGNHPLDWDDPLFEAVKASYDSLPNNNIKRCFLCCSWWPKDCSIRKNELIGCWVGLGLIDGFDDMLEAYLMGYHIIRSLLEASLLEAGDDVDGEVRMHALIRGVALRIAPKTLTEIVPESIVPAGTIEGRKVRWKGAESAEEISLMNEDIQSLAKDQFISPELKTLILRNNPLEEIPGGLLHSMTALTYLDLSYTGIKTLPEELGMLTGMQYLNLSHTPILSMTWAIGNLVRLRYLHLSYTPYLKHIPLDEIGMLVDLRLLHMFRSEFTDWDSLFNLLDGVGGSKSKRRFGSNLMDLGITVESISVLVQLSTLPAYSLASRLSITKVKEVTSLHLSPIRLRNLEELCIEDCIELEELIMVDKHIEDEKYLCLTGPTALQLHRLARLKKISWKGAVLPEFLRGLHSLEIDGCSILENITWASKLPFLDKLTLSNCKRMKQVIKTETAEDESIRETMKEEYMGALSSIRYLLLRNLPKLYVICNSKEEFPYLRSATIDNCPNLKLSPGLQDFVDQKKVRVGVDDIKIRVDGPDMTGNLSRFLPVLRSGSHSNNLESAICIDNLVKHLELEEDLPSSSGFYGVSDDVSGTLLQKKICEFVLVDAHFPSSLRKALYNAFVRADLQLPIFDPGTNVLTAIVYGGTVFIASAGKSRAVLGRRDKAIELMAETLRKEDGDKPPFNLTEQTLTEEDEFLIMATNGLWDVMSSQHAVTIVREELMCHNDPKSCSEKLVQLVHTQKKIMHDNLSVSVVVVCFSGHPPPIENPTLWAAIRRLA